MRTAGRRAGLVFWARCGDSDTADATEWAARQFVEFKEIEKNNP